MHKNQITYLNKSVASAIWLGRWSATDAATLVQSATYLSGYGIPAIQSRAWPQRLVKLGLCHEVQLNSAIAGIRKIFTPTPACLLICKNHGVQAFSSNLDPSKIAHRLLIQRMAMATIHYVRKNNGLLLEYYTEAEIPDLAQENYYERWPDAILKFKLHNGTHQNILIEIERSSRSHTRLLKMANGIHSLLENQENIDHQYDSAAIFVPTDSIATRYQEYMLNSRKIQKHKITIISNYSPSNDQLERITLAKQNQKHPTILTNSDIKNVLASI